MVVGLLALNVLKAWRTRPALCTIGARGVGVVGSPGIACADRRCGPDRLVALCAARLKAGGAYVPLDASDRLRGIVEDSQPALVLADAVGRAALGELDGALPVIDLETDALRWREMPATNPEVASQHVHHLAYVIYTSGSTGRPKG